MNKLALKKEKELLVYVLMNLNKEPQFYFSLGYSSDEAMHTLARVLREKKLIKEDVKIQKICEFKAADILGGIDVVGEKEVQLNKNDIKTEVRATIGSYDKMARLMRDNGYICYKKTKK